MIESVYYQIIEYVIAPIGLMIFTFFVKGEKETSQSNISIQDTLPIEFKDNAIESLFIASYSHLLYFFSLAAHSKHYGNGVCRDEQFASLLASIAGLLIIFIYKYFYGKTRNGEAKELLEWLNKRINYTALGLMLFLTFIIVDSNMNINNIHWTFSLKDFLTGLLDVINFSTELNNFIFIPFISVILFIVIFRQPKRETSTAKKLQALTSTQGNVDVLTLMDLFLDPTSQNEIKYNSIVKLVGQFMQAGNYEEAMKTVKIAKKLAISYNYPESQLIGLRYVKVEVHCFLNERKEAEDEISEVELNKSLDDLNNQQFYDLWIKKLREIIDKCCKSKSPN